MKKWDFKTYQKRFQDFEILPKFSETHIFRGTIRYPSSCIKKPQVIWGGGGAATPTPSSSIHPDIKASQTLRKSLTKVSKKWLGVIKMRGLLTQRTRWNSSFFSALNTCKWIFYFVNLDWPKCELYCECGSWKCGAINGGFTLQQACLQH